MARRAPVHHFMDDHVGIRDTATSCEHSGTDDDHRVIGTGSLPITAHLEGECVHIEMLGDVERSGTLLSDGNQSWLDGVVALSIRVDLPQIVRLTSPVAACLGTLTALGIPVTLFGANRRVGVQLPLLGLGKICQIELDA